MSRPRNGVGVGHNLLALGHRDPPCEVRRINYVQKGRKLIRRTEPLKHVPWVGTVRAQSELGSVGPAPGLTDRPNVRSQGKNFLAGDVDLSVLVIGGNSKWPHGLLETHTISNRSELAGHASPLLHSRHANIHHAGTRAHSFPDCPSGSHRRMDWLLGSSCDPGDDTIHMAYCRVMR